MVLTMIFSVTVTFLSSAIPTSDIVNDGDGDDDDLRATCIVHRYIDCMGDLFHTSDGDNATEHGFSLIDDGLNHLYERIRSLVRPVSEETTAESSRNAAQRKCCLIFDDISLLEDVGVPVHVVLGFIAKCRQLICSPSSHEAQGAIVLLAHDMTAGTLPETSFDENIGTAMDKAALQSMQYTQPSLDKHLQYMASLTMLMSSLPSGYSRDVHGQLRISSADRAGLPSRKKLQFKVLDSGIAFFAPGTSAAVL
eukprot:m.133515 g.133515  ORF g.133515 m.133515 type:complete len:252 (-) comp17544_c0_seq5:121-876(-)